MRKFLSTLLLAPAKSNLVKMLFIGMAFLFYGQVWGQYAITGTGSGNTYTQNFDAFRGTAVTLPTNWVVATASYNAGTPIVTSGAATPTVATASGNNCYAGRASSSSSDYSILQKQATSGSTTFTFSATNNTADFINGFVITWNVEQFASAGRATTVDFSYAVNGGTYGTTGVTGTSLFTATTGASTLFSVVQTARSISITGLVIPIGASINFRYTIANGSGTGSNAHIGIDDFTVYATAPTASNCSGQMTGTYTINPGAAASCSNYQTFASAVSDLVSGIRADDNTYRHAGGGVSGAVILNVTTGTYTEQITIGTISGTSGTNTVTFKSASGTNTDVVLTNASSAAIANNYTLQINGTDYLRFEDMTISRTGSATYARVIDFIGTASYNIFDGNIIAGRTGATSITSNPTIACDNTDAGNTNNAFTNNSIRDGYAGIYWFGTSGTRLTNLTISGNTFTNFRYGVFLQYGTAMTVTGNTISVPSSFNAASMDGISTSNMTGMLTISKNNIVLTSATSNKGIYLLASVGDASNIGDISNNMVVVGGSGTVDGINSGSTTSYKNYYYNSVYNTGSNATSSSAFYLNGSANINLRNNILYSTVGNAIEILAATTLSSDYNDLYSTGTYVGYWTADRTNLAAYQSASGMEANSISADPGFTSTTNLHVNAGSATDAEAEVLSITTDIDGQTRNASTPDIGADEYNNTTPNVQLSVSVNSGSEAAATVVTVTATASAAVTGNQTVNLAVSGTGITGGDYTLGSITITILSGATTGTTTFTVVDDASNEGTETATLTISSPSAGIILGSTTTQNITITDNDQPVITTSTNTLTGFTTSQGTPSANQTFTVSGDNLTGNLSMSAVTGFEYSLDNSTFTSTLTIPVSGGNVTGEPRTIYVRLTGASTGSFSGNTTISGGGASSVDVALSGTVTVAPCSELFISEYHEAASGNEKYIEIYNPTSSAITLAGTYALVQYNNGSGSVSFTLALSGSISGYGTVYAAHSSSALLSGANASDAGVMTFNGNDVIALRKSGVNIDVMGTIGSSANFAVDVDLRRLATVSGPVTTYNVAEWSSVAANNVTNIGTYTNNCTVANPTVNLSINTATGSEAASTSITLTATASAAVTGDQTVQVALSGTGVANADFSSVTFPVNITILNGQTTGTLTFTINNDVAVEGTETATFTIGSPSSGVTIGVTASQNLAITDDDNVTSSLSVIDGVGGETATISSLTNGTITNSSQGAQVWQFRLYDGDGSSSDADTKPTVYEQFTIRQSPGNTVPVWNTTIDNVKFFLGASVTPISGSFLVSATTISFTPTTPISVADNGFEAISMRITLDAPLASGSDGLHFGFSIDDADVTVDTDVLVSSQLGTFTETSNASLNEIAIIATLQFINAPTTVGLGDAFTITVSAIDANGNIDQNNTSLITLSQNTGTGTMTGGGTANLVAGTYTWTGLSYNVEETFQVIASGGSFSAITANITVTDEDFQLFDHFNRTASSTVGIPSSGGSTAWTETEAGDGTKVQIFSNMLFMDNCVSSDPNGSSGGTTTERINFNGENHYETVFNNSDGTMNWLFNMRTNNSNLSGFAGSAYAMAFILGCDQADFTASGSDGYAVVVGNSGTTDYIKIVRFANGLSADANVTDIVASDIDIDANYASVKVSFNPCDGVWTLYARNDGASAFTAPNVTSPAFSGPFTATNTTHAALDLKYFGAAWKHNSSCVGNDTYWDNFYIPNTNTSVANTKTWNGSVSSNWNTAANWSPCPGVPTITDNVIIPVTANNPIISASPSGFCKDLTVNATAQLTINSGQFLNAHGNVVNNGNANFGAGTLQLENVPIATVTVTGAITVGNFYNSNNATLAGVVTVTDQARVETGGTLNANGNLVLNNNAQLFHGTGTTIPCACEGTVSGNVVVKRNGTSSASVYNYWSTPISSASLGLLGGTNYLYNPANGTADFTDDNPGPDPGWAAASGSFAVGKGYAGQGPNPAVTFTGTANNGTLNQAVQYFTLVNGSTSPGVPYNLIGNPYPSNIDAASFLTANNTKVTGAIYYWDDDNTGGTNYAANDYAIWNGTGSTGGGGRTPNGMIATAQGFFVQALSGATSVSFTNAMRASTATTFFKTEEVIPQRLWLRADNGTHTNQILVGYVDGATEDMDWFYDAQKLRGNHSVSFYSLLNDTMLLGIQGLTPLNGADPSPVPLGLYSGATGQYSIYIDSIENFSANLPINMLDADLGIIYDLRNGPYIFQTAQGEDNDRFVLFPNEIVTAFEELDNLHLNIYPNPNNGTFTVMINSGMEQEVIVSLFDVTGKLVLAANKVISSGNNFISLETQVAGVYMLKVETTDKAYNKRVVVY